MGFVDEIKSRNERDDLEDLAIKTVNGYFRSNNVPLHAFKQKKHDRKEFYKNKTEWLTIPVAPRNVIFRTGYNVIKKLKGDAEDVQAYLNNADFLVKLTEALNGSIAEWYFEKMKRSQVDQKILVKVVKRRTPIKGAPI